MNKYLPLAVLLLFSLFACDNEINVAAEYKDIPFIYGKISQNDSIHYIRIQKGFLSKTTNAYDLAKYKDSIYYKEDELNVVLKDGNNIIATLTRINATNNNMPKDTGAFYSDQNILYTFNKKLIAPRDYQLVCTNLKNNTVFNATTNLIGDLKISNPDIVKMVVPPVIVFNMEKDSTWSEFSFRIDKSSKLENWDNNLMTIDITLYYDEWNINTPNNVTSKTLVWNAYPISKPKPLGDGYEARVKFSSFLATFASIPSDPNIVRRLYPNTTVKIKAINSIYTEFLNTSTIQNNSISSDEALKVYTNVVNGRGLFYSDSYKETNLISISANMIDYIACSPFYAQLQFLNTKQKLCK